MKKLPTYFISHGGGPWPFMKHEMPGVYDKLEESLKEIPRHLGEKPKAILMVSGHWEESDFAVQSSPRPSMLYDYGGFPEYTYHVQYPAPGSPELALQVKDLLERAGLRSHLDAERGFDHGTFSPLVPMYPDADVPVVQLSIRSDYDVKAHFKAGHALESLRSEGILIIGSGLSYHNLRAFGPRAKGASHEFDDWLNQAVVESPPQEREAELARWSEAPSARQAHPSPDHLIPLMVAAGAAQDEPATRVYHEDDFFGGIAVSSFRFG